MCVYMFVYVLLLYPLGFLASFCYEKLRLRVEIPLPRIFGIVFEEAPPWMEGMMLMISSEWRSDRGE